MPFQPINFANVPTEGNSFFRQLREAMIDRLKYNREAPMREQQMQQMQGQNQSLELANAFNAMRNQQEPQQFQSQQALREAQIGEKQGNINKQKMIQDLLSGNGAVKLSPEQTESLRRNFFGISQELPSERTARETENTNRQTAKEKELIDYRLESAPMVPKAAQSKFVKQISDINSTLPMLDKLKTSPGSFFLNPSLAEKKQYDNFVKLNKERIISSAAFPKIKASYGDIDSALRRAVYETDAQYARRITDIQDMLKGEYNEIPGEGWKKPELSYKSEEISTAPKDILSKTPAGSQALQDKKGEWHYIPNNLVDQFKKEMQ